MTAVDHVFNEYFRLPVANASLQRCTIKLVQLTQKQFWFLRHYGDKWQSDRRVDAAYKQPLVVCVRA